MRPQTLGLLTLTVTVGWCSFGSTAVAPSFTREDGLEAAKLLALLLDSGRVVLARHQAEINDPTRGDKGWPPSAFETEVIEEFARRSGGIDLRHRERLVLPRQTTELLLALVQAGREAIEERRHVIDRKFLGFKNVIPATWGTWTAAKFSLRTGVRLKQTALDFRNPANAPDVVEREILQQFADQTYPRAGDQGIGLTSPDGRELRYLLPLFHQAECLLCHGKPKGELDVSGYRKEGHESGDLAGAISVTLPLSGTVQ